jgi:DNA polymerase-3 subunit delta'
MTAMATTRHAREGQGADAGGPTDDLPWLGRPLAQALATQRGHALLVQGPPGVGQFRFCVQLAQAWLCEATGRSPDQPACGACASCHLFAVRAHPDLLVLLPEALQAALGWGGDEETDARSEAKSKAKPSGEIKVDAVRRAVGFAQQTSARGRSKVVVLHPAEQMNAIAANTLLKTLEEPPGAARFILSTGAVDALLPTIRSRCQQLRLPLPPAAEVLPWLAARGLPSPQVLLGASGGQPLTALELAEGGLTAERWAQLPQQLAQGQAGALAQQPLPRVLDALSKLCHDAAVKALGGQPRYFPADAVPAGADPARLTAWAAALRRAQRHAEHPLALSLQLEALLIQARQALAGA